MTNLEVLFSILGLIITSIATYYTYKAFKKKPESISKTTQVTIGGDSIAGDKVSGDKVTGNKIVYTTKEDK